MTQANEIVDLWTPLSGKKLSDLNEHDWQKVRGVVLKSINLLFEYEKVMSSIKHTIDEHLTPNDDQV